MFKLVNKSVFIILIILLFTMIPNFVFSRDIKHDIHIIPLDDIRVDNSNGTIRFYFKAEKALMISTKKMPDTIDKKYRESTTYGDTKGYYKIEPILNLEDTKKVTLFEKSKGADDKEYIKIDPDESELIIESAPPIIHIYSILLLDVSGSVTKNVLNDLKDAAKKFVEKMKISKDKSKFLAVYAFDGKEDLIRIIDFSNNEDDILSMIDKIDKNTMRDSATNMYGAIVNAMNIIQSRLESVSKENLKISTLTVFTDGRDTASRLGPEGKEIVLKNIRKLKKNMEFYSYTIGLGNKVDKETLQLLGNDFYIQANATNLLVSSFQQIADTIENLSKSYYKVQYQTPSRKGAGVKVLKIEIDDGIFWGAIITKFDTSFFTF